jgi:hypothetical protein
MTGGTNRQWGSTRRGRPRRVSPMVGCLFWVLVLLVVLLLVSVIFGGFEKGTKAGSGPGQRLNPAVQEVALGCITGPRDRGVVR